MRLLLVLLLHCLAFATMAQHTVTGRVVDDRTHEPLPFVGVMLKGEHTGTTTGIDGRFTLGVPAVPTTLVFSYVGYDGSEVVVPDEALVVVYLTAHVGELEAVKVHPGENPAHRIIKRVLANRKENDGMRYRSYRYKSYSKTIFTAALDSATKNDPERFAKLDTSTREFSDMMDRQHLFLIESATQKSFIPPSSEKEEVLAMRVSGLKDPSLLALAAQTKTFSIYEPQINISEKSYLGPIGPNSWGHYLFIIEDTLYQGTDSIFVISYQPRKNSKFEALQGLLWINTDGYAVQNVIAEPVERKGMSIKFQQMHQRVDGKAWFPVQLNAFIYFDNVNVNDMKLYGEGRTFLKDIELDADVARKEVRGPELVMDQLSMRRDDAYWNTLRNDSLDSKDLRTYTMIDSLGEAEHFDRKAKVFGALSSGRLPMGPVDLVLRQLIAYNGYEGFRLGAGLATNDKLTRYASLGGYFAYGFNDAQWKYGGDLTIKPFYGRDVHLKLSYENDVDETGGVRFPGQSQQLTSESYRLFYMDRMDRIERIAGEVMLRASSSLKLWLGTERSLRVNELGYEYLTPLNEYVTRADNEFLTGAVTLAFRWAFRERLARLPDRELALGTKYPVVYVQAMQAVKGLYDGEWDAWRVNAMVEKTFRLRLLGNLSVRALGGVADPNAPMPFLYNLRGTWGKNFPVSADNTFETMLPNEFLADRYVSFHVRHSFGTLLVKGKHFRPEPSIMTSAAFGEMSHPELHRGLPFKGLERGYFESGLRIDGILRSGFSGFGVGLFYRYGPYANEAFEDNFAVKLAMSFNL